MTRRRRRSASQTLGGIIVGFDQQIFRTTPPAHESVQHAQPVRGSTGQDASDLVITLPSEDLAGDPVEGLPQPASAERVAMSSDRARLERDAAPLPDGVDGD